MKDITVKKVDLIEVLKKNRAEHRDAFLKAQESYRETAIKILDEQIELAKKKQPFNLRRFVGLIAPQDHTDEYDRAIEMLTMDIADTVELTERDFKQFVQDDWGWMAEFANTASSYGVSSAKLARYTNQG